MSNHDAKEARRLIAENAALRQRIKKLEVRQGRLKGALQHQHDWHMRQCDVSAYQESGMADETLIALHDGMPDLFALPPEEPKT